MSAIVALLLALIAVAAHRRARGRPAAVPWPALRGFVATALATWLLAWLAARPAPAPLALALQLLALAAALAGWIAMTALVAVGWRRRDLWLRVGFGLPALLVLGSGGATGVAAFLGVLATFAWRWKDPLPTTRRFTFGLAALALAVVLLWVRPATGPDPETLHGISRAARHLALALERWLGGYALFGALALFRAWVRDPSLGIRAVNRRLALSHVLVGLVPLLLVAGLWATTTFLGVLNERAIVGARAIAARGRWLELALTAAVRDPAAAPARLVDLAEAAEPAARSRVWWRTDGRLTRLAGDPIAGEAELGAWLDSLSTPGYFDTLRVATARVPLARPPLPHSGVLRLGDSLFVAAVARVPGAPADGAVIALPLTPVLAAVGDSIARARLEVWNLGLRGRTPASFSDDDTQARAMADSLRAALSGRVPGESRAARRERVRRAIESTARAGGSARDTASGERANRLRGRIVAEGDTFAAPPRAGEFLLQGHALATGLERGDDGWRRTRFLMTASEDPWRVASGLARDTRTDPLGVIPLAVIVAFTLVALVVFAWDLAMVTGMGRSIAEAVAALRGAATRFGAGDLTHRIELRGDDDLWQVAGAFNVAATELERARAAERERQRIENELDVARRIQTRLLPSAPPEVAGFEVAGHYDPAREVGGDYYDHIALDPHRVLLVIADVSGKSVPAALIMSGFRAALVSQDLGRAELSPLAERLNDFLNSSLDPGKFVTAFLAVLDGRDGSVSYVNAGHNPPVLLRADGRHESLEEGGTILGILPGSRYARGATTMAPGDLLVLYTDGVTEGARPDGEQWGDERLVTTLRGLREASAAAIASTVAETVRGFEGEAGATDDVTLVVARRV